MKDLHPGIFVHKIIPISDSPLQNLIQWFPACVEFIQKAREQKGTVLVHCNGGISRAPAVVVAYLMESQGWEYSRAYSWVQNIRFCINPNTGFKNQLQEYEPIYKARKAQMISDSQHLKRSAEFE
jgi:serine/threonine/tyrosine-interacting protein